MRWLIVTDDHAPLDGGVSTWTGLVGTALRAAGHEVVVAARARSGLPSDVIAVRGPSFGRLGGLWTAVRCATVVRRVDRVLATTWPVATGLVPVCRHLRVPLDVVAHGSDVTRPAPARRQRVVRGATRWLVSSSFLADQVRRLGRGAEVLPAPIAVGPSTPGGAHADRWILVARATPLKGGDRFVRLVAAAGVHGTVVGDGPALEAWRGLAVAVGAGDRVRFLGRLPREATLAEIAGHDLAVLLPRADADGFGAEGLGLALLEAASRGVPVVGCRTGGVPEAVGPGLILADPDDVGASVARIREWWSAGRGAQARDWLEAHHGPQRTVQILTGGRHPAPTASSGA